MDYLESNLTFNFCLFSIFFVVLVYLSTVNILQTKKKTNKTNLKTINKGKMEMA